MHYIEVYFCQQSEFGDSADSSNVYSGERKERLIKTERYLEFEIGFMYKFVSQ